MVLDGLLSRGRSATGSGLCVTAVLWCAGTSDDPRLRSGQLFQSASPPLPSCRSGHPAGRELSAPVHGQDSPSAAVNEAVRCATLKQGHASGFVNGVLRQVSRRGRELLEGLPEGKRGMKSGIPALESSSPCGRRITDRPLHTACLGSLNETPDAVLRVNTLPHDPGCLCTNTAKLRH